MTYHDTIKEDFINDLISKMTLEEKVGQMNQYNGFWDVTGPVPTDGSAADKYADLRAGRVGSMLNIKGVDDVRTLQKIAVEETRLGIPLIFGFDIIHGYKTIAPIPLAEAASWDLDAIRKSAQMAAREASSAGINWTFAPMIDLSRDARWGRVMEGGGEDPYLASKIAVARVQGFQGDDLSNNNTIAACAKHFAAYGFAESGRDYNTVDMSGNVLHNVVLPPFKAAVEAGVATVMNAFNELNGVPATSHSFLQRHLLKNEWGFEGFVVSDWGSIREIVVHGQAADLAEAAKLAAKAGCDMDMEASAYVQHLTKLVEKDLVEEEIIDDAVSRILGIKYDLGLFQDPYGYCDDSREKEVVNSPELRALALDVAKKSIVLLKNENDLLPLKKDGLQIAVIGPLADEDNSPLGSWRLSSDDHTAVSLLEGIKKYDGNSYTHHIGVRLLDEPATFQMETVINETDPAGINEAKELARQADVVIIAVGEHGYQSGEGRSRTKIDLPGLQQQLLEDIYAVNKNIVLVLMNGRPLAIPWAAEHIPSILECWQLGTETGNAISEVIMGDYNPSGKLPVTFPRSVGQVPIYYNQKSSGRPTADQGNPKMVFWSHYTDEQNTPLFSFGHGLSYTTFDYSDLRISSENTGATISVVVENTGKLPGEEVVQLYIRDRVASLTRPVKELKGFEKISLSPGEEKRVSFRLTGKDLGYYDNDGDFLVEAGEFDIMVGGSSEATLQGSFTLSK